MKKIFLLCITSIIIFINGIVMAAGGAQNPRSDTIVTALLYHDIAETYEMKKDNRINKSVVPIREFEAQMAFLHENGYHTITLKELREFLLGKLILPDKSVLITFDDGYESNYTYAYPVLKKYGFKAAVFAITSTTPISQDLNRKQIKPHFEAWEMEQSKDVFEFACHTDNLHSVDSKGVSVLVRSSDKDIMDDLEKSRKKIDSAYIAYPYGQYNDHIVNVIKNLGYDMAFTTRNGYIHSGANPYTLKRWTIYPYTSIEAFSNILSKGTTSK